MYFAIKSQLGLKLLLLLLLFEKRIIDGRVY